MSGRTVASVRVALCLGRHRWGSVDLAREVALRHIGAAWWACPLCGRYHVGPPLPFEGLEDLAWVARALAGNQPG